MIVKRWWHSKDLGLLKYLEIEEQSGGLTLFLTSLITAEQWLKLWYCWKCKHTEQRLRKSRNRPMYVWTTDFEKGAKAVGKGESSTNGAGTMDIQRALNYAS